MSIKIEGDGNKENVFSDSDSGMPLWNGVPFVLLPPDLSKARFIKILSPNQQATSYVKIPFIVPEDGWIVNVNSDHLNASCIIDGISDNTPFIINLVKDYPAPCVQNTPYPVKKGQVISIKEDELQQAGITFAPCMSV